jgi:hypothetical protein
LFDQGPGNQPAAVGFRQHGFDSAEILGTYQTALAQISQEGLFVDVRGKHGGRLPKA